MTLHTRGLLNKEIVDVIEIKQEYGVELASFSHKRMHMWNIQSV
jgi:hypothetical protein